MITRIFLDLDDVLNSFTMPALRELGCNVGNYEFEVFPVKVGYNIQTAASIISHGKISLSLEEIWDSLHYSFWASLPKSLECNEILSFCARLTGRNGICILTSPTRHSYVSKAKVDWINVNLPKWCHGNFLIGSRKELCARPDALLIDDSDKNCWDFTVQGGKSIIFPRPWN